MQLNGFKISEFNQYSLEEKCKTSTCPLCSKDRKKSKEKCLSVFWDTGLANCNHCGERLQLHKYKQSDENKKVYKRPVWANKTMLSNGAVLFFEARGINQDTLKFAKVSTGREWMPQFKKEVDTIQFNYTRFGELINVKFRGPGKSFKLAKDAELIFYNLDNIQYEDECYIVEGEMDALTLMQIGINNVISVPNGATLKSLNLEYLDNCIQYFEKKEKIFLCLDNDEPGESLRDELKRRLGVERCYTFDMHGQKDANDYMLKYGGEMLKRTLSQPIPFPLENVVTMAVDGVEFDDFWVNGMPEGLGIGLNPFDNIFKVDGFGRFIVVTGIPTHGKSEFVDQLITGYAIEHGWKTGICSPENHPAKLHKAKIFKKIHGLTPSKNDIYTEKYKRTKNYLDENFFFCDFDDGNYDLDRVLDKCKELIFRKGIKCFVIDPYNKIRLKKSLSKSNVEYTNDYLSKIDEFCKKYKVLIILVAHPVKMQKLTTGARDMPDFYDIKGGGEFYDMSPFGLCVHRDFESNTTKIKVLKVKFQHLGCNQAEVEFKYNVNNGRFTEIADMQAIYDNSNWLDKDDSMQLELNLNNNNLSCIDNDFEFSNQLKDDEEMPF